MDKLQTIKEAIRKAGGSEDGSLADVLLAMPDEITRGTTPFSNVGNYLYTTNVKTGESIKFWNLLKPLHEQDEVVINFIWEILK